MNAMCMLSVNDYMNVECVKSVNRNPCNIFNNFPVPSK